MMTKTKLKKTFLFVVMKLNLGIQQPRLLTMVMASQLQADIILAKAKIGTIAMMITPMTITETMKTPGKGPTNEPFKIAMKDKFITTGKGLMNVQFMTVEKGLMNEPFQAIMKGMIDIEVTMTIIDKVIRSVMIIDKVIDKMMTDMISEDLLMLSLNKEVRVHL